MELIPLWEKHFDKNYKGQFAECRSPGAIITQKGTILRWFGGRSGAHNDWAVNRPVICRSTDDGDTWSDQSISLPESLGGEKTDTLNNPCVLVNGEQILLAFHQNYSRAFITESVDDGLTWSEPSEITQAYHQFPYQWNVCATGPGHGMVLADGQLAFPIWLANGKTIDERRKVHWPSVAGIILSSDHGKSWHAGGLYSDINDANENTIAQLPNGNLVANIRCREDDHYRRICISQDSGIHFSPPYICHDLPDPWCMGSMINAGSNGLLYCGCESRTGNPEYLSSRVNLKIKQSFDGITWKDLLTVDAVGGYCDIFGCDDILLVSYEKTLEGVVQEIVLKKYAIQS